MKKKENNNATKMVQRYWMARGITFGSINIPWWWILLCCLYLVTSFWFHWNHGESYTVLIFHPVWLWLLGTLLFLEPGNKRKFGLWVGLESYQTRSAKGPALLRLMFYVLIGLELAFLTTFPQLFTEDFMTKIPYFRMDFLFNSILSIPLIILLMQKGPKTRYSRLYLLIFLLGLFMTLVMIAVWLERYPTIVL